MPKPEEAAYLPTWDETKLAKTKFRKLMDLRNEAKAKRDEFAAVVADYEERISSLLLANNVEATRIEAQVARWIPEGKPGRKLVPTAVLEALGGNKAKFDKCFAPTKPRVKYFRIFDPKETPTEEATEE